MSIYDDHEIRNDFSSSTSDEHFGPANEAFQNYLGQGNPPPTPLALSPLSGALQPFLNAFSSPAEPVAPVNYFEYRYADAAFFVLDARAYRSENLLVSEDKTMLGPEQMEVFMEWIARVNETVTWKFIVSSTPMMSLWGYGEEDTWAGFMDERERVLDVLEYVPNVIVLSGVSPYCFRPNPLSFFFLPAM
jgi:alkaline phosphatase D